MQAYPPGTEDFVHGFPRAFNVYERDSLMNPYHTIGPHKETPIYAVTMSSGLSGKGLLVIRNGPDKKAPALASVDDAKGMGSGTHSLCTVFVGGQPMTEMLKDKRGLIGGAHVFNVLVFVPGGRPGECRPETFGWRTKGKHALELIVSKDNDGSGGSKSWKEALGGGSGGHGDEVLATWADESMLLNIGSKKGHFEFKGRGATGELGPAWTHMAVLTGMRVLQKVWEEKVAKMIVSNST